MDNEPTNKSIEIENQNTKTLQIERKCCIEWLQLKSLNLDWALLKLIVVLKFERNTQIPAFDVISLMFEISMSNIGKAFKTLYWLVSGNVARLL